MQAFASCASTRTGPAGGSAREDRRAATHEALDASKESRVLLDLLPVCLCVVVSVCHLAAKSAAGQGEGKRTMWGSSQLRMIDPGTRCLDRYSLADLHAISGSSPPPCSLPHPLPRSFSSSLLSLMLTSLRSHKVWPAWHGRGGRLRWESQGPGPTAL